MSLQRAPKLHLAALSLLAAGLLPGRVGAAPARAETVAVVRNATTSWIIARRFLNGPPNSRAFAVYQAANVQSAKQLYVSFSFWTANCPGNTLSFFGASPVGEDLTAPINPIKPKNPPQVLSSDRNPTLRAVANAVCGDPATDWRDVPDINALMAQEIQRIRATSGD